jgi:xanthine dehydrogenase YagT iron-sulfur-binding subunit
MKNDKHGPPDSRAISRRSFIKGAGAIAAATGLIRTPPASADATALAQEGIVERIGPGAQEIELKINGEVKRITVEPRVTLLRALRDHLNLTGTKLVCDRGACGACTVHLDGKPVTSCMILALDARGHEITTIEGLLTPDRMSPLGAAFVEHDAAQCGFCTPGMVMSMAAALASNPKAQLEDVKRAVAGNICRCGTYPHVFAAALSVVRGGNRGES